MLIETQNLTKIYRLGKLKIPAISRISLKVRKGEFLAIMGPSGSGKSTLLNLLGGLDRPTTGSYKLEGEEVSKKSPKELAHIRRDKIGFVFQTFNLLPRINTLANVELPLIYKKIRSSERKEKAIKVLNLVGLERRAKHKPNELSGGEQQRAALARALINNPSVILADEPTGNLDSHSGRQIMEIFKKLNETQKVTIILVTHEEHLARYADRLIHLKDGKIVKIPK